MTKIMSAEEWVDKTYGTDISPDDRKLLALLAPMPEWVIAAMNNLIDRGIDGASENQLQEMFQEELAAAKAAAGVVVH